MSTETDTGIQAGIRASRLRVPRSRGALSGIVLIVLGAWAALVPFIGPYFNFAFTPAQSTAWHWTSDRGWLDVLPGAAAVLAGLILLLGANRLVLTFASWLGVLAGAWLVVGPVLAPRVSLNPETPDPTSSPGVQTLESLFFYYATGAAIVFFAALALGRLTVHSVRDARSAQRRVEAVAAREEERRRFEEQRAAEHGRNDAGGPLGPPAGTGPASTGRHEHLPGEEPSTAPSGAHSTGETRQYPPA